MQVLKSRRILLGVTGGIAAYKAAVLVRALQTEGAEVRVIMSRSAQQFVTPLTFQALSGHPVYTDEHVSAGDAMEHISLTRWADAMVVAPASANFLAKLAHGLADDLLCTSALANQQPLFVAPAMNHSMWNHPATQENVSKLLDRGVHLIGPEQGDQACGENGPGRMSEPDLICSQVVQHFTQSQELSKKKILITAGPTHEPIDPVRYIGNRSSGKMGYAVAAAALSRGAEVVLVSGPTHLSPPPGAKVLRVETAQQMYEQVMSELANSDIFISVAAVADYRPSSPASEKIKKTSSEMELALTPNADILLESAQKFPNVMRVGFAAETQDLETHAKDKLIRKNLDILAANWVGKTGAEQGTGFGTADNALLVLTKKKTYPLPKASKQRLAQQLMDIIETEYHEKISA
ncbi:MAG: bifunctional phosphopantothenoylcysteine decarboxylase/phosphopantothenate--cysteine ligase CoaBC [Gammaproteobacteria bacterium]|nr:bifunctional phosphopantothenoylcysteine decarboxylase/phosphopantothenate--cysteine ligase CoaBC [Gammaproteobacteria bacterium]